MPVRCPRCAILSSVPPQVCSTSSRWAAMARISSGVMVISIQTSLLQHHNIAHDQAVRRHFLQSWQDASDMFISIDKDDDYRELAASIDEVAGLYSLTSEKSGDGMEGDRSINIFLTQVIENFNVERPMMPLIGFVEIDGDLYRHRVWHFTAPAPVPCPRAPLRGTADCCRGRSRASTPTAPAQSKPWSRRRSWRRW